MTTELRFSNVTKIFGTDYKILVLWKIFQLIGLIQFGNHSRNRLASQIHGEYWNRYYTSSFSAQAFGRAKTERRERVQFAIFKLQLSVTGQGSKSELEFQFIPRT